VGLAPLQDKSDDESRNNVIFGILALGEGWHNAHHAFPTSARHGLRWWQIDVSYYLIRLMSWVGLAWKVNLPSEQALERATRRTPSPPAEPPPTAS
jgi:stearoyl-CoA desaturase (Delta-9 desaturase)